MKVAVVSPERAGLGLDTGNRVTARRWARLLRGLGHQVTIQREYDGRPSDALIALHARKSYPSLERFRRRRPGNPVVVALTGTDLYRDIQTSPEAHPRPPRLARPGAGELAASPAGAATARRGLG